MPKLWMKWHQVSTAQSYPAWGLKFNCPKKEETSREKVSNIWFSVLWVPSAREPDSESTSHAKGILFNIAHYPVTVISFYTILVCQVCLCPIKGGYPSSEKVRRAKQTPGIAASTTENSSPPSTAQSLDLEPEPKYCPKPDSPPATIVHSGRAQDDAAPYLRKKFGSQALVFHPQTRSQT